MDDEVRLPDAPEEPDGSDTGDPESDTADDGPVAAYAPPPREEAAPRLDLDHDPFAPPAPPTPAYPVLDLEPLVPTIDALPEPAPVAPAAEDTSEPSVPEAFAEEPPAPDVSGPADGAPAPVEETEAADLSLQDMVDELTTGEEPLDESGPADTEYAPEPAEQVEGEETAEEGEETAEEGDEGEATATWRDAVAASSATAVAAPELVRRRLSTRLPFWIYGGAWAAFVGALTYLIWPLSDRPFVDSQYYAYLVYGGAGMLAIGLVLAITVWAVARSGAPKAQREGLVRAVCLRTVGWMTAGVILWWAGMYALDMHRLGVIG